MTDEERGALKAVLFIWFCAFPLWVLWKFGNIQTAENPLGMLAFVVVWVGPIWAGMWLSGKDERERQSRLAQRKATAYQEAAHGVIANRFGLTVGPMTIRPGHRNLASMLVENREIEGSQARERILSLFAGAIAERELDPHCDLRKSDTQSCMDSALELLKYLPEPQSGATVNRLFDETRALVRENWRQISAVAITLLERQSLTEEEWTAIVDAFDSL